MRWPRTAVCPSFQQWPRMLCEHSLPSLSASLITNMSLLSPNDVLQFPKVQRKSHWCGSDFTETSRKQGKETHNRLQFTELSKESWISEAPGVALGSLRFLLAF